MKKKVTFTYEIETETERPLPDEAFVVCAQLVNFEDFSAIAEYTEGDPELQYSFWDVEGQQLVFGEYKQGPFDWVLVSHSVEVTACEGPST